MAYEVLPWKHPDGCTLTIKTDQLTERETYSREINEEYGEGGALNADHRTLEAAMVAANEFRTVGLRYGIDFHFKTGGLGEITLNFSSTHARALAEGVLGHIKPLKGT